MKRIILPIFIIFFIFSLTKGHVNAYSAGKPGSVTLSPTTGSWSTGQSADITIVAQSGGTAISGFAVRVVIPVVSSDIEVTGVDKSATFTDWTFPVKAVNVNGSNINVDIMAINPSVTGGTLAAGTAVAVIHIMPKKAFSAKPFTFDQSVSVMYKKDDASDILGSLGTGSYGASGQSINPTTAPTSVPTATPTQGSNPTATPTNRPNVTSTPTPTRRPGVKVTSTPIPTATPFVSDPLADTPVPTPTPPNTPSLFITPFYNANNETAPTFTVRGTTEPSSLVELMFNPDNVLGSVKSDASGAWRYEVTKPLTTGEKELSVTVTTKEGAQVSKTVLFTVVSKSSMWLYVLGALALGFVGVLVFLKIRSTTPPTPPASATTPAVPGVSQAPTSTPPVSQPSVSTQQAPSTPTPPVV